MFEAESYNFDDTELQLVFWQPLYKCGAFLCFVVADWRIREWRIGYKPQFTFFLRLLSKLQVLLLMVMFVVTISVAKWYILHKFEELRGWATKFSWTIISPRLLCLMICFKEKSMRVEQFALTGAECHGILELNL